MTEYQVIRELTIRQAIKKAVVIQVETTTGTSVKITKKEALRYVNFCESTEREYKAEMTTVYDDRILLNLS